jgi:E3 ubiquitin ligase SMURF1/2
MRDCFFVGLTSYDGRICHFTLKGIDYAVGKYPVVHACFNSFDLPLYPTKELMREALLTLLLADPTGFTID